MTAEPRVVLVGRAGCHLCDEARVVVASVCDELDIAWVERDVDVAPDLPARYCEQVPVVLVDEVEHAHFKVDPARLRRALV